MLGLFLLSGCSDTSYVTTLDNSTVISSDVLLVDGDVGIGKNTADEKLDLVGNFKITGNITNVDYIHFNGGGWLRYNGSCVTSSNGGCI